MYIPIISIPVEYPVAADYGDGPSQGETRWT
ncbi:hypothetical protein AERO9A_320025 [Aeromonas salmonicida]|nr:hypothetical protein AERO9A_320025 [Aeromonas salmonicida]